jgi:hypothetical protein
MLLLNWAKLLLLMMLAVDTVVSLTYDLKIELWLLLQYTGDNHTDVNFPRFIGRGKEIDPR